MEKPYFLVLLACLVGSALFSSVSQKGPLGEDFNLAPPAFFSAGKLIVPIDFQFEKAKLTINIPLKVAKVSASIEFYSQQAGYPMFDLVPEVSELRLNGVELGPAGIETILPPCRSTQFRALRTPVEADSYNVLEIVYAVPADLITFSNTSAKIGFFMSDTSRDRSFLEKYLPANFEFDRFRLSIDIEVLGALERQELFTNGYQKVVSPNNWTIDYPYSYTSSSFYFHLTTSPKSVVRETFQGVSNLIPITIYGQDETSTQSAKILVKQILTENELNFGPYAHPNFLAYITETPGGMEYAGATVTNISTLSHEITHSWFARGVMPSNGNSGWIDEAIASWRDDGYPSYDFSSNAKPVNLAAFSPYRRTTPIDAYTEGSKFMGYLNTLFQTHQKKSLKSVLKEFYHRKKNALINTATFQTYLEELMGEDLSEIFDLRVYGKANTFLKSTPLSELQNRRNHPRPFTENELISLR